MDQITLNCSACGKEITVPADLEVFSCVYCGAKQLMSELLTPGQSADEADREFAEAHLLDCVRDFPNAFKQFNRKQYEESFRTHREAIRPAYEAMDRYVCAQPYRREELLIAFADSFVAQWDDYHREHPKARTKHARDRLAFSDKLTLAWYTVPAIRDLGLSVSEDYVRILHERYNAKYPDNSFEPGTYAEISGGFRKHGFCFVTTAVCEAEGKPDNCPELNAFRAFRDGWLSETASGRKLIADYYELAPAIVAVMRYGDREAERCAALRRDYLTPCYEALRHGENETCKQTYIRMIRDLRSRYGLQ